LGRTLSLFSGVGGIEKGLASAGVSGNLITCEAWDSAREVLQGRFATSRSFRDVRDVDSIRNFDLLTAGFPCTDLSQAGLTQGLDGEASGLVLHVLDLLDKATGEGPRWVLLENVPNMLYLSRGQAMSVITGRLQAAGYRWAYRVLDSRFTGLAQRRRRVFLLASRTEDPAPRLLGQDAGPPLEPPAASAFGFYWTEGNRGLGWAEGTVPTLKGGSTVRVPSPPAVWVPSRSAGDRIVIPSIEAAEVLQGFRPGWTSAAPERDRWKLVGNAVSTRVARWIGQQLLTESTGEWLWSEEIHTDGASWPTAARWDGEKRWAVRVSEWPTRPRARERQDLAQLLEKHGCSPLSHRATVGFRGRLTKSSLRYPPAFMAALDEHIDLIDARAS
jgi:DNA (cytosine-5)-methyltransferase 1